MANAPKSRPKAKPKAKPRTAKPTQVLGPDGHARFRVWYTIGGRRYADALAPAPPQIGHKLRLGDGENRDCLWIVTEVILRPEAVCCEVAAQNIPAGEAFLKHLRAVQELVAAEMAADAAARQAATPATVGERV